MSMTALLALLLLVRLDGEGPEPVYDCRPLIEMLDAIGADVRPMPPEAVPAMLVFHNTLPPPGQDAFAAAAYATAPNGGGLVLWLRGSDVCGHDVIPAPIWVRLRPLIEGMVV